MKYFGLVWKNAWRKKIRTALTILSVFIAFLLFALLSAFNYAFNLGDEIADAERLITIDKISLINLLPIPILDGGHIFFFMVEIIKGRPVSERSRERAAQVGLFMILSLMVLAFYNDIMRIIS